MKSDNFRSLLILFVGVTITLSLKAQVVIGTDVQPNPSALLEIRDNPSPTGLSTKGLLLPRVAIVDTLVFGLNGNSKTPGMIVYGTSPKSAANFGPGVYYWNGTKWVFTGNSIPLDVWKYGGNTILPTTSPQSIGTKNAVDLNIITNNTTRILVDKNGRVSIKDLPTATSADAVLLSSSTGEIRKLPNLTRNDIPRKYTYTTAAIANGQAATVTLAENPVNSTIIITCGTACHVNGASVTLTCSSNNMIYPLSGWAINAPYTFTANSATWDTVTDLTAATKDPANTANPYTCTDGSGADFANFRIVKIGLNLTITNLSATTGSPARVYTVVQIAY